MKKITAILLVFLFIFSLTACGKKDKDNNNSSNSTPTVSQDEAYTENDVIIETKAFPKGTVLKVEAIKSDDKKVTDIKKAIPTAEKIVAYEITAKNENVAVQPDGTVEVKFPIPEDFDSTKQDIAVYYLSDDGKTELITSSIDGDCIKAVLSHFSTYAVIITAKEIEKPKDDTSSTPSNSEPKPESQPEPVKLTETEVKAAVENALFTHNVTFYWRYDNIGIYSTDYKAFSPTDVFTFLYYYLDKSNFKPYGVLIKDPNNYEYMSYDIPVAVLEKLAKDVFGNVYDFTKIEQKTDQDDDFYYDPDKNLIHFDEPGGFGSEPDDDYYYKSFVDKGNNTIEATLEFCILDDNYEIESVDHTGVLTMKKLDNGIWQIIQFKKN